MTIWTTLLAALIAFWVTILKLSPMYLMIFLISDSIIRVFAGIFFNTLFLLIPLYFSLCIFLFAFLLKCDEVDTFLSREKCEEGEQKASSLADNYLQDKPEAR